MTHRLFIGLRPPAALRTALLAEMHGIERARWQDEGQLHLTLRFVGEVDRHRGNDLAEALGRIDAPGFTLELRGTGVFEKKGKVHTLWAGIAPAPALARLQRKVERACHAAGLAPETRAFVPHVTLARLNRASGPTAPFLARTGRLALDPWPVESFWLYESHLHDEGARYEPVLRVALRSAA